MATFKAAFSGFSTNDLKQAKQFYSDVLGLKLLNEKMGLEYELPGDCGSVFIYEKEDHKPATYTTLNFVVDDIDASVDELTKAGVTFEQYDMGEAKTDEKGVLRGLSAGMGPDIAWFKDPASNTLAVLQDK